MTMKDLELPFSSMNTTDGADSPTADLDLAAQLKLANDELSKLKALRKEDEDLWRALESKALASTTALLNDLMKSTHKNELLLGTLNDQVYSLSSKFTQLENNLLNQMKYEAKSSISTDAADSVKPSDLSVKMTSQVNTEVKEVIPEVNEIPDKKDTEVKEVIPEIGESSEEIAGDNVAQNEIPENEMAEEVANPNVEVPPFNMEHAIPENEMAEEVANPNVEDAVNEVNGQVNVVNEADAVNEVNGQVNVVNEAGKAIDHERLQEVLQNLSRSKKRRHRQTPPVKEFRAKPKAKDTYHDPI